MIKLLSIKNVLFILHLAVWVLLHAFIIRYTNYLTDYDSASSIINTFAFSAIVNYYTFKYMTRQAFCIYVGMYDANGHL
jgi:hypothetical protein